MKLEGHRPLPPPHRLARVRRCVAVDRLADAHLAAADLDQRRVALVAAVVNEAHVERLQADEHPGDLVRQVGPRSLLCWRLLNSKFCELLRHK